MSKGEEEKKINMVIDLTGIDKQVLPDIWRQIAPQCWGLEARQTWRENRDSLRGCSGLFGLHWGKEELLNPFVGASVFLLCGLCPNVCIEEERSVLLLGSLGYIFSPQQEAKNWMLAP